MPTVSYEHLYGLAVAIYEAAGASTETAQTVARHQVEQISPATTPTGYSCCRLTSSASIAAISSPGWIP